jgi:BMFP domain-containing protein YqiC
MLDPKVYEEVTTWIPEAIAASLARDIENNLQAMIAAMAADLARVTHEDFDLQARVLQRIRQKLNALEAGLVQIDMLGARSDPGAQSAARWKPPRRDGTVS